MILRKITDEEIQAITTLFKSAENIGSAIYTDENIKDMIKTVYANSPQVRAKDVDIYWMLDFMKRMKDNANEVIKQKEFSMGEKQKALYIVRGKSILDNNSSIEWYFTNNKQLDIKQKHLFSKEILADIKKDMKCNGNSYDIDAANELFTKKEAFSLVKNIINKKIGANNRIIETAIEVVNLPISVSNIPVGEISDHDLWIGNEGMIAYGTYVPTPTSTPGTAQFEEMPF